MVKKFGLPVFFFQVSFLSEIKMAYLVLIHAFFKILFYFILFYLPNTIEITLI